VETLEGQVNDLASDCESERKALDELLAGQTASAAEVAALVRIQTAARQEHERLTREVATLRQEREKRARAIAGAGQDVARLKAETESRAREIEAALSEASTAQDRLAQAARANGWADVAADLDSGRDPAPAALEAGGGRLRSRDRQPGHRRRREGHRPNRGWYRKG
jgi:cell division septum initiation protein DivIVA